MADPEFIQQNRSAAVTSEQKKTANKRNALRSTGPRTAQGKSRSSRNSRRHGLTINIFLDRDWSSRVEKLARAIASDQNDLRRLEHARALAGALLEELRVQALRTELWNLGFSQEDNRQHARDGSSMHVSGASATGSEPDLSGVGEARAFLRMLAQITAVCRYERCAQARIKRAVHFLRG
jgi:hypothetical protein